MILCKPGRYLQGYVKVQRLLNNVSNLIKQLMINLKKIIFLMCRTEPRFRQKLFKQSFKRRKNKRSCYDKSCFEIKIFHSSSRMTDTGRLIADSH